MAAQLLEVEVRTSLVRRAARAAAGRFCCCCFRSCGGCGGTAARSLGGDVADGDPREAGEGSSRSNALWRAGHGGFLGGSFLGTRLLHLSLMCAGALSDIFQGWTPLTSCCYAVGSFFGGLHQGALLNALLTLAFAANTLLTDAALVQSAALFRAAPGGLVACTFEELAFRALGPRAYVCAAFCVVVGVFGALIGFLIVIGDVLEPVAQHLCGAGCASPFATRAFIIPAFALVVALPLSSLRRLHSLAWPSVFAAVTVLGVGALVVARGAASGVAAGGGLVVATAAPPGAVAAAGAAAAPFVLFRFDAVGILLGIPISIFSLGHACQIIPTFCELGLREQRRFSLPVVATVATCFVLYCATGAFGYAAFRDSTRGDVLLNFPVGADAFADAAKALLGLHVVLAYPVLLFPGRESIKTLLLALSASSARGSPQTGGAAANASSSSFSSPRLARLAAAVADSPFMQSAALVLSTCGLAVLCPEVATIFGLVGSTAATVEIFIVPGLLMRRWAQAWALDAAGGKSADSGGGGAANDNDDDARGGAPLLGETRKGGNDGDGLALYAPYGDAWSAADRERVWAGAAAAMRRSDAEAAGSNTGAAAIVPSYLSRSPAALFAQSSALLAFGAFVGVASTSMYVWTTWLGGGG